VHPIGDRDIGTPPEARQIEAGVFVDGVSQRSLKFLDVDVLGIDPVQGVNRLMLMEVPRKSNREVWKTPTDKTKAALKRRSKQQG
jgi:hypothetical protein